MNAVDLNKDLFEERMSHVGNHMATRAPEAEIWRTIPNTNYKEQISNLGRIRITCLDDIMKKKAGKVVDDTSDYNIPELLNKIFPLESEEL